MGWKFNPPPGWPQQPLGWTPPQGWTPDPSWPPAPEGWQFWVPDDSTTPPESAASPAAPGGTYVPAAPPKARRTWLWVLGAAGVIAIICCGAFALSMSRDDKQAGQQTEATAPPAQEPDQQQDAATPGMGDPVRDGKFEFIVQKVECGAASVGGEFLTKEAQGQFCLVTLSVKNIGDEPQTMSDSNQKAVGSNGARYNTDSEAGFYANDDNAQVWVTEINPGNEVTGRIVFDVPQDVELVSLELHDSAFSGGVDVAVK